jgi:putative hemolysin
MERSNGLTIRLADCEADVRAAQRLRYLVFYEEMGAKPDAEAARLRLDRDHFDGLCDHLLVINRSNDAGLDGTSLRDGQLVGTYRLMRQEVALAHGGFYSEGEFELATLLARRPGLRLLEVGRSCVARDARGQQVAELLWQGIWNYVRQHGLNAMTGCASLPGTDPSALADELSFLAHHARAPADWQVRALPRRRVEMALKPLAEVNGRAVLRRLPTLIKGYLRLGCHVGDGAVIDWQFNTTDVLILLPIANINPKYFGHFGAPAPTAVTPSIGGDGREIENVIGGG